VESRGPVTRYCVKQGGTRGGGTRRTLSDVDYTLESLLRAEAPKPESREWEERREGGSEPAFYQKRDVHAISRRKHFGTALADRHHESREAC